MESTSPEALEFCRALKVTRERRGISLEDIAGVTKVCVSHFDALERGDLRHWPKAIFRRAFFRGYIEMIGLPIADAMNEFARLFPDDDPAKPEAADAPAAAPLRLGLDSSWHGPRTPIQVRIKHAIVDVMVVLAAAAVAWLAGAGFAGAAATGAIVYFTLARVLIGDSPAAWMTHWLGSKAGVAEAAVPAATVVEPAEAPVSRPVHAREWRSDARRVRQRDAKSRVRLRFKVRNATHSPPPS